MSSRAERAATRAHRARAAAQTHEVRRRRASDLDATQAERVMVLASLRRDNVDELAALVELLHGEAS